MSAKQEKFSPGFTKYPQTSNGASTAAHETKKSAALGRRLAVEPGSCQPLAFVSSSCGDVGGGSVAGATATTAAEDGGDRCR